MNFFINNFHLFCICIAMGFITYVNFKGNKKHSSDIFIILGLSLALAAFVAIEEYTRSRTDLIFLATLCSLLGYVIRPIVIYFFIRLADRERLVPCWIFIILFVINFLFYLPALFINNEALSHFAYYYVVNATNDGIEFVRGSFNFSSHILSGILLAYLVFISFRMISLKHRDDALMVLTCVLFVVIAVLLESLAIATNLLNMTISISCVFYYLFLNRDDNRRDALTRLFTRKTYYVDLAKYEKRIVGVISIDMNGLKYLNDTKGHEEGDNAIICVGKAILMSIKKDMLAYRMGGDEFLITAYSSKREELDNISNKIKNIVESSGYYCSTGVAYKDKESISYQELVELSEVEMYNDKANFYKTHRIERRKSRVI